jgi:hypothetical protein
MQFLTGFEDKYSPANNEGSSEGAGASSYSTQTANSPYDSDICDPNSNLNKNPNLITQEIEGE